MQSLPQLATKELAAKRELQAIDAAVRSRVSAETTAQLKETLARLEKKGSEKWGEAERRLYGAGVAELNRREGLVAGELKIAMHGAQASADANRRDFLENSFHFATNPSAANYRKLESSALAFQKASGVARSFQEKAIAARAEESRAARAEDLKAQPFQGSGLQYNGEAGGLAARAEEGE